MIRRRRYSVLVLSLTLGPALAAPITFNTALPVGDGKVVLREQLVISRSGDDPLGVGREVNSRSLLSLVAYGINAKLAMFGILPYTTKDAGTLGGPNRSNDGLGDSTVFGRYTLYQQDWPGRTLRVAGVAGVKVPTGIDNDSDGFGRLPASLQLGTGSWDGFVGGVISYQTLDFGVDTQLSYRENTAANGFEAGDEVRIDVSYQHRLLPGVLDSDTRSFLYGVVELNTVIGDRHTQSGVSVDASGGTTIFLTPGLQYVTRKLIAEVALQVPVVQNLNGTGLENDFMIRGGFRINF